jgi:glutathionyl-hydroquinone reductase
MFTEGFHMIAIILLAHWRWRSLIFRSMRKVEGAVSISLKVRDVDDWMYSKRRWEFELVGYRRDDLDDLVRSMKTGSELLLRVMC